MAIPPKPINPNASRIDRRFDVLRSKVEADASKQEQAANEGLQRKAAAQGMQGSGAFMKLGEQNRQALAAEKNNVLMDVEAQREGAQAQADELETGRNFAREQMGFQSAEAEKDRAFQSSEAAVARGFSKELFDKEMKFKNKVQKDASSQFKQQMDLAKKQFKLDKKVSEFNMGMAQAQYNQKDLMETAQNMFGYDPRTGKFSPGGKAQAAIFSGGASVFAGGGGGGGGGGFFGGGGGGGGGGIF